MTATQQYFPAVLFISLYKVCATYGYMLIDLLSAIIQVKAAQQYLSFMLLVF